MRVPFGRNHTGGNAYVTGWGYNPITRLITRQLQLADVRVLRQTTCKEFFNIRYEFIRTQMCFVTKKTGTHINNVIYNN